MTKVYKLSLPAMVLINLNIMLGVGLFINTTELAKRAGVLGALSYVAIGILLLPLIFSIVQLLRLYPIGGFYTFGTQSMNSFAGFISTWSYFIGKLASTMLVIHIFVLLIQEAIPFFSSFNPLILDCITLTIISLLNLFNIKTGSTIQAWALVFKMIPIAFLIFVGIFFMQGTNFVVTQPVLPSITGTLPLVLYATLGFEAACSLSSKIKDAHKNAPRAVLISYGLIILLYCLYQLIFYGVLGTTLAQQSDFRGAFPALLYYILPQADQLSSVLIIIFHLAIAASALGAAYGMIYSNMWNLYILAQHHHTFAANKLILFNKQQIPFLCIIVEGIICLIYLATTHGDQLPLQKIGAFGVTITYIISALSLLVVRYRSRKSLWLPLCGLANCIILLIACINSFFETGITDLGVFALLFFFGIFMFWYHTNIPTKSAQFQCN